MTEIKRALQQANEALGHMVEDTENAVRMLLYLKIGILEGSMDQKRQVEMIDETIEELKK